MLVVGLLGYRGDPISPQLRLIFDAGNRVEDGWERRFRDTGVFISRGEWLPYQAPPGEPVMRGRLDIIIERPSDKQRFLVEVKSTNTDGYYRLPKIHSDPAVNLKRLMSMTGAMGDRVKKYVQQTLVYLHRTQMSDGYLLFDNKNNQQYALYHLRPDPEMVKQIYERLTRLAVYWRRNEVPPWNGGVSKHVLATHRPNEAVPIEEFKRMLVEPVESF